MGCVNTNSKEFKDTAKRLNVHPSALEGVVHEFINTKGNEELFPSDDYIQKRLKGEAVKISAEDLELCTLKGWRNTQYFGNYNAMINQMTEMQKFLPEGMVIGGRDHDGNYTISLAPLVLDGVKLTPIRQEYQGKLIYSQSKSGKSTIADGKTVIDLDTYKDFYGDKVHLTALNPDEVFKALDEGKTILTSDPTLLNWADVIVYSSNLNDIVERTKETTPFDSPESYQGEIDNINETINSRRGGVEVIKLSGKDDVLGKHILSDPNYKQTTKGKETTYSTEEKKILKSAPRNTEGKLLAPNGEVSNLTEKQYAQVRTKAFKEWFGDWENNPKEASKVVDQNGEPLVVYHGTPFNFTTFKKGTESYFTNDKKSARFYSTDIMDTDAGDALGMTPKDARLMPVFLNIKNPYRNEKGLIRDSQIPKHIKENQDGAIVKAIGFPHTLEIEKALVAEIKTLQKQYPELSYDEVLEKVTYKGEVQYVIKDPNQAKSATENTGEFSTLDNDIYADGLFSPRDFDRETPAPKSIKRERLQKKWKAEWDAIKTNDWNLPKTIQERVEKKLKEYEESQYGYYKGEVDTTNYFGKENKTTAKSVLEYIAKNSTDSTTRKLAARLLKNLGNNEEVPVTFGFAYGAKGIYNATEHSVAISKDALKGKTLEEALVSMEGTIIHEIAHAITVNTMIKDSNSTKDLDVIYKEYKELGTKYGLDLGYGAKNQEEFVAEFLGNKFFREVLMALPSNTNKKVSIGRKILNFILEKVFGITPKDTFFHRADKVVQQLLDRANSREITEINNTETYAQEDIEKKFTFNDGTTVDAPFQPNAQQTAALNAMGDFIKSDKNVMTLSGYAGTGKTSLMEMIAKKCRQEDQNVIFCASTNKAAAVLNDKVSRSHFEAKTLHKIFGISVSTDMDNSHYDSSKLKSSLKGEDELVYGSTVIIDEASMINEKTYNIIKNKAEKNNCKIIFVGDEAQLAPVNEDKISVVFRQNDGKVERLTQVERTGDNAILKEATAIRDGKPLSGKTSFNDKGEGVAYITPQNTKAIDAVINAFIPGLQNDADHFRILAYTNEAVANYNDRVRRALGYTGTIPRVGEPMMGYDNWGYDKRTKSYDLTNSESYKVTEIENTETVSKRLDSGETIEFQVTYITLENSLGEKKSFPFIDVKGNAHNRESAEKAAREVAELYKQQANTHDKNKRKECFKKINALREFLFINDNILDGNSGRKLASKVIDFGYAMTIHKSQGSTFKNVLLDDANIKDNMATSEEKQQLEYVGVSRATDTVTVISNNVKKEGTPMQYSKGTPTIDTTDTRTQESPERKVTIPPTIDGKVQPKETFSIKVDNGIHIYNSRGEEVFNRGTEEDTRNRNKVITNYRFQEGSAVRVQLINKEGKPVLTKEGKPEEVAVYKDGTMISIVASPGEELFATTKAKASSNYQATLRLAEQKADIINSTNDTSNNKDTGFSLSAELTRVKDLAGQLAASGISRARGVYDLLIEGITPSFKGKMTYAFNGESRQGVKSATTIEAIKNRERTATTRYSSDGNIAYWSRAKKGDVIEFTGANGETALVEVTVPLHKLDANTTASEWSKKEGWNEKRFNDKVKPRIDKGEAYQMEFRYIGSKDKESTPIDTRTQEGLEKATRNHKQLVVDMGNDANATQGIRTAIAGAKKGITLEEALGSHQPFFTQEEIAQIEASIPNRRIIYYGNTITGRLEIMSVSRRTDPIFFADDIVEFLKENGKKPLTDPTRTVAMEIWSKHDGLPLRRIMEACKKYRVAPMLSFSITGLGGTALEKGVMKYNDMLDKIQTLIKSGVIDPTTTTIRIDPILVGETKLEDIKAIVERAKGMGIKKFVTSLVQSYGYTEGTSNDRHVISGINDSLATEGRKYEWDKYYGRNKYGKINFTPKQEYIDEVAKFLVELNKDPNIEIQSCAFPIKGLKTSACLDPYIIQSVTGINIMDSYIKDEARPGCDCYGVHQDFFKNDKTCNSSCAYCYAKHSGDNNMRYYDNNGKLVDDVLTRTSEGQSTAQTTQTSQENKPKQDKSITKKENKNFMEKSSRISTMRNNLNNSSLLKASEVRKIGEKVVDWISDHITSLQQNPEEIARVYGEQFKDIDISSMSRAELVNKIGIENIFQAAKDKLNSEQHEDWTDDVASKADELYDNFDALIYMAHDRFAENEGFSISLSTDGNQYEVNTEINEDADNFNASNKESDTSEIEKDQQEHWQVETKTRDVIDSMNKLVKDTLRKCLVLDSKGEPVRDDFGFNEKVDIREAVNFIYNTTKGSLTLGNMISKLKEKVEEYPWLTQLLEKLEDTTGEYNDLQSQFFGDIFKPFQSYHVVIKEGGKFKSIPVNENPVLQESLNSVKSLYYIGEHPLFITQSEVNHKTFDQLKERVKALNDYTDVTDSNVKGTVAGIISEISQCLGYSVTPEIVATGLTKESLVSSKAALANIIEALEKLDSTSVREKVNYDAFSFKNDISIRGNLKTFLSPIVQHFEDIAMASTYDDGKMYQSYVTPSYLSKLMIKFATTDEAAFKDFIQSEYGQYSWFWDSTNNSWNNDWLEQLDKNPEARKIFKHKVQLNFDGKHYMKGMSDAEYALSVFTEYFGDGATGSEKTPAWFRIPMQSNKPSSEFIRFYSDRSSYYKSNLTNKLFKVFCQELSRIQTVTERNLGKSDKGFIANFDKNGNRFHFLEYMNKYLDGELKNTELGQLLRKKLAGEDISQDMAHFADLVKEAIRNEMDAKVASIVDGMYESGIAQAAADNLPGFSEEVTREKLENFVWNDTFAAINILQLTVTDIAFYKNAEDLQKRLAEIHAPGIRGRVDATDYNGRKVSDGKYRAIKLADFNKVISNIIDNLTIVFDRKIANAKTETERRGYEVLKDSLVGEKGLYRDINVTDAQAYNCPTSYRKKAIMFGKWSKDAEKIWETLASGKANLSDIKVAFQPLKPTVFSHAVKNVGTKNSTMNNLKVPIYYKNSEYLLIMADAILRGENTGKPNLLRALFDVMEESHFTTDKNGKRVYKTDGIDTIIFESGVKSGLGGQVSLNDLVYSANGEALAKERLEASIYNSDGRYNTDTVDVMAFEDYCLQQEVPEHFKDHAQVFGSQLRYIGISELESIDATGEAVKYHIGKDAEGKTAQELKEEYENLIAQNIQESMDELYEELCVGEDFSLKEKNAALSKILQREILASPRYGIDLLQACSINENGDFNIPLGDPIQSKRVQQLINSIVKNRINKQKIAGGPVVQVTSFGTSTELGIKFKDGKGGLLLTRKEWENSSSKEHTTYDDYIKENQKGIAYMEVLAPAYASDILRKFTGSDGVVNVKALEMLDPELLEMIGYRIPTEEKYSAAPLKIVGFLPREAGEGIMLPYDITLINGSDYDVDKEYIMRKVLNIKVKPEYANKEGNINKTNMSQILWNDLIKSQAKEGKEKNLGQHQKTQLSNLVKLFLDDPFNEAALTAPVTSKDQISMTKGAYNRMLRTYLNAYEVEHPGLDTKEGRDNRIIDILNSVLTHETSTDKVLNPGGFEEQKKMGYLVEAIRNNPELTSIHTWEELENMSIDELKELSSKDKNLCYIDTQFQFYKQNSAAGSLIGIFAVNRTAHAAIESGSVDGSATYFIDGRQLEDKDGFENVSIDGVSLGTKNNYEVRFDMRLDINGMPIGKTLGSLVGASADAVKDPVLNLMNINSDTANVLNALLRVGVPFRTAALFLSQGSISRLISRLNMQRLSDGYGSLSDIALERFKELNDQYKLSRGDINSEDLSIEDLIDGIKGPKNSTDAEQNKQAAIEYKVLKTLIRSLNIADALRLPTFATRFNSITSAVGPLVIDNLITEMQGKDLNANSFIRTKENGKVINVEVHDILNSHPILNGFAHGLVVARRLFSNNSPLNSTNFRGVLEWVSGNFPSLKAALISSSGRTLFNTLGNIYQTMLLYKTGVLKSEELGYFINDFPKEFMKKDYKNDPRFKDNELIKMIRYTSVKNDNSKSALSINTTSLDTAHKEKLSNALIDLYKTDQEGAELAIKLFKYNVFKGGIDFSPKTFTHLFPSFIKERIPGETSESGYIDTFRKLPELEPATVINMLVRNNYDNNRLAPVFKDKAAEVEKANKNSDTEVDVSGPRILDGVLERFSNGNKQVTLSLEDGQGKSLIHTPYFKMYDKEGNIRLFSTDVNVNNIGKPESVTVTEISKLGNGKEYMELYNETNHEALSERESNIIDESPNDITSVQDGSMDTMLNHSVDGRKISSAELIQEALKYSSQVQEEARTEGVSAEQKVKDNYIRMSKEASKDANQVDKLINFVTSKLKDKGFDISKSKLREDIEKFKEDQNIC